MRALGGGESASLACGLAEVEETEAVVGLLGDQPRVPPEAIRRLVEARGGGTPVVRATYRGVPGHPLLLERELFGRMRDVTGDRGARNLLRSAVTREVPCDDLGGEDVDTPDQLEELRAELRSWTAASRRPIRACSHRSGSGAHQFQRPSSSISDGTRSARMIEASISTARAVPMPFSLMKTICEVAKAPMATLNRSAAEVTMRPVRSSPIATASLSEAPWSRAS